MSWQEFADTAPGLARGVRDRFEAAESPVLATLRRDARFAIHAHPAANGDAQVAGVAAEVTDPFVITSWRVGTPLVCFERPDGGPVVRIEQ